MTDYSPNQIMMIKRACELASLPYPDTDTAKSWLLGVSEVAKEEHYEMRDNSDNLNPNPHGDEWGRAYEIADHEIPYSTYHLWIIWADLQLYSVRANIDLSVHDLDVDNLDRLPQAACYEVVLRVVTGWE